jgi:hypothetical protein
MQISEREEMVSTRKLKAAFPELPRRHRRLVDGLPVFDST